MLTEPLDLLVCTGEIALADQQPAGICIDINQADHYQNQHDTEVLNFLNTLQNHKTVVFPTVPTAENMAAEAFKILKARYQDTYGNHLKLEKVRLYETPNSWADALG